MTKQVQRRRGTATQHTSFTGAEGELSVNTTNKSVHVHDNVTAGGFEAARVDMDNVTSSSILTAAGITATTAELNYVDGVTSAIQTQIDGKAGTASPTFTGTLAAAAITSTGVGVTGNITVSGTVDGRDVATDGTKLDGIEASADVTDLANVTAAGALMATGGSVTGNISFGDNDKAIFGAGSDLQIYHDGSQSFVEDTGTGELRLASNGSGVFINKGTSENMAKFLTDGAVELYYDQGTYATYKLATTSTGVDIAGVLTSDGLTVDGDGYFGGSTVGGTDYPLRIQNTDAGVSAGVGLEFSIDGVNDVIGSTIRSDRTGAAYHQSALTFATRRANGSGVVDAARIDQNGNISFYEDTGSTPKLHWSATDERLGIGTISPSSNIDIEDAAEVRIDLNSTAGRTYRLRSTTDSKFIIRDSSIGSDRLTIDSSGNVGIGMTPDSAVKLSISGAVGPTNGSAGSPTHTFYSDADTGMYRAGANSLGFSTGGTERMRIDSSGNVLVGKTSTSSDTAGITLNSNGAGWFTGDGIRPLLINRKTSDGDMLEFRKDGTTVGSIGVVSSRPYLGNASNFGIRLASGDGGFLQPTDEDGAAADNLKDIGSTSARWDDIFATNGTIQTSDRNEKQDIEELSDAEQRVAVACKGLLRKFRWRDSVEAKGDNARTHFGIIAQDLQAAFSAEGLDAGDYAMFISSTWTDEDTGEERTRMGVRYSELLAFIIAAI